ncbi:Sensor protein KdpD [Serratia rubidaea]|uniref:Sensor protein KdpD n=1 Tax=Serratia rubidaea TaxID=61652 RepID=A0A3S4JTU4_SERRU|nr:Sensor protein KdpD [Serratia rubidaea]
MLSTTRLVNNLLDMARIQSGGFILRKEWQSLEEIVGASLHMLEPIFNQHEIKVELPDEMVLINCDGSLLERVFTNLLENADKYAGQDAIIGIRARTLPEWLEVEIWDNGPALPPSKGCISSTNSPAAIKNPPFPASVWGWRSAARLSSCTAGGSGRIAAATAAPALSFCCRWKACRKWTAQTSIYKRGQG